MDTARYKIKEKIGQGGAGEVYRAVDTQLNREVALKRVINNNDDDLIKNQESTNNLLKEAAALGTLQHPHIVTIYDVGVDDTGAFVVMELIDGMTLDKMIERGVLTLDDLYEVALQTQEALIAAQDLGMLHRDLKPSNIMVCWLASGKFQVKIVDFGLAKFYSTPSSETVDHGASVFGSIFFMAPEQFEHSALDQRTDMYSIGCLYYYALTGKHPFDGDTAVSVMASHLQHHITPLQELRPDLPDWASEWVMWHMNRDMEERPINARTALEKLLVSSKKSTQAINAMTNQGSDTRHTTPIESNTKSEEVSTTTCPVQIQAPNNALNPHTQSQETINNLVTQNPSETTPKSDRAEMALLADHTYFEIQRGEIISDCMQETYDFISQNLAYLHSELKPIREALPDDGPFTFISHEDQWSLAVCVEKTELGKLATGRGIISECNNSAYSELVKGVA